MKKILLYSLLIFCSFPVLTVQAQDNPYSLTVFDEILFYDGYAATVDEDVPEGVIRQRNDLYTTKLTDDQLDSFGNKLKMDVVVKAACDNYDRIGNVNLALVPKGNPDYDPDEVERIELGRFITPFMNKNVSPYEVPYEFYIDNVTEILTDETLRSQYDFWVELQIFGVPYAANEQVSGCAGRNDVFYGTLTFSSSTDSSLSYDDEMSFIPLSFQYYLNDYNASDVEGETTKLINFTLDEPVDNAHFYLITSNHGANAGGEEYNRREHYVYLDDELVLQYKPGGKSCEPYRQYNTQPNGIYGYDPLSDAEWASFSNWCPGDKIPIRMIELGDLDAGDYTFKLDVPDAVFNGDEGYFPVSLYFQNRADPDLTVKNQPKQITFRAFPNPTSGQLTIQSNEPVKTVEVYNTLGQKVMTAHSEKLQLESLENGLYLARLEMQNGLRRSFKIIKK